MIRPYLAAALVLSAGAASAQVDAFATDILFPEGPMVRADGTLLFAQYAGNVVSAWDGAHVTTLWEGPGCGPSAVAPLGENLAVTCYDDGTVAVFGPNGEDVARFDADSDGIPMQGPNDFAPDGSGGLWMTASGPWESGPIVGKVYHVDPGSAPVMRADDLHYANGIVVAPDGRLYVNESEAGRVISFAIGADGTLTDRRLFVRLFALDPDSGPGAYPDGIKIGPDGNFWIGQYSSGRILTVSPDGALVAVHEVPSPAAPNLAFSADGSTAYVTAVDDLEGPGYAGTVYRMPLD